MKATRTEIGRRVERLEGPLRPDVCRCGVEDLLGARNITAVYGDDPDPTTCPDCERERIVIRFDEAFRS